MSLVKNLILELGNFSLNVNELEIPDQGITAIMGPSGCGKSTFLKCLLGIHSVKGFTWDFGGKDLASLDIRKRRVGIVFQDSEIFPHMSVAENLKFSSKARGFKETSFKRIVDSLGLIEILDNRGASLSGGERQRVALGNALISDSQILLLDEPFSNLDEDNKVSSRELVKSLVDEFKVPAVLVTHDARDADALAKRVYFMESGRIQSKPT